MKVLVTGGVGYIGSHTVVELMNAGHSVVIVDNLSNSSIDVIRRIETITGKKVSFYQCDICDKDALDNVFRLNTFECCLHLAGFKSVGESVVKPLSYYSNNIAGTLVLLEMMSKYQCKNIIFSSSATVYGNSEVIPLTEDCPKGMCTNPYGRTKSILEDVLLDVYRADQKTGSSNPWNMVLLRYFNPIGAHKSGLIGENPKGSPNNIMPLLTRVASGEMDCFQVFGGDYDTPDGTCIRDYIHVVDLAKGHVKALAAIEKKCGVAIYNLGTGIGYSVLDVIRTFEKENQVKIPYEIVGRRDGDVAICYSDASKAWEELGWKAEYTIRDMCKDSWNWKCRIQDTV